MDLRSRFWGKFLREFPISSSGIVGSAATRDNDANDLNNIDLPRFFGSTGNLREWPSASQRLGTLHRSHIARTSACSV